MTKPDSVQGERVVRARVVAEYWRDEAMKMDGELRTMAHPLALVLGALDGEADPLELGIPPAEYERRLALASQHPEGREKE